MLNSTEAGSGHLGNAMEGPSGVIMDFEENDRCHRTNISPSIDDDQQPSSLSVVVAGGLAGMAAWALIYPIDVVKSYIQTSNTSSDHIIPLNKGGVRGVIRNLPLDRAAASAFSTLSTTGSQQQLSAKSVAMHLYRQHGWKVFYRGLTVTMARAFPVNAIIFYVYENSKSILFPCIDNMNGKCSTGV
jgi:hypothetical protein